jgi:2Fe-2S ferredoxin
MSKITFKQQDGSLTTLEGRVGQSIMELATSSGVAGIDADCGGACACATCHVIVDNDWHARLQEPAGMERDMLDFVVEPTTTSRLSCQLKITDTMDGLVVSVPSRQS